MRLFLIASLLIFSACSGDSSIVDGGADSGTNDVVTNDVVVSDGGSDAGPQQVTFSYTPQWTTVSAVSVYGGFGQSTDWTMPFLTLANNGSGTFTGTASLPPGQYLYVFKVVGDDAADVGLDAGTNGAKYARFAVDPGNPAYMACPSTSPTYSTIDKNPCSELTVPQPSSPPLVHVNGTVTLGGNDVASYLVILERNETGSHHFFVNRLTTRSDGAYDLMAAPGQYRVQVQYPTILSHTDAQRDPPTQLAAMRRLISSDFKFASAAVMAPNAEVAFNGYTTFLPTKTGGTLPTAFTFTGVGGAPTHLDIYGTGMDGGAPEIGDPWFNSAVTTTGTAIFDGGFNTAQKMEPSVSPGERYFWGVEEDITTDAGVNWTAQTMVFDITWP